MKPEPTGRWTCKCSTLRSFLFGSCTCPPPEPPKETSYERDERQKHEAILSIAASLAIIAKRLDDTLSVDVVDATRHYDPEALGSVESMNP